MKSRLVRSHGFGHLHFITCCCYRRLPFLGTQQARDVFLRILSEVRDRYDLALLGYVVMPDHIHLLISEPSVGTTVVQVLKQRVSRALRRRRRRGVVSGQMNLWEGTPLRRYRSFWQRRFYDFNVWSARKKNEKLNYIHFNPVRRGLAATPNDWLWSSYGFYAGGGSNLCVPNLERKNNPRAQARKGAPFKSAHDSRSNGR